MLSKRQRAIEIDSEDSEAESIQSVVPPRKRRRLISASERNGKGIHPPVWRFWGKSEAQQSGISSDDETEDDPIGLRRSSDQLYPKRSAKGKFALEELPLSDPRSPIWVGRRSFKLAVVIETGGYHGSKASEQQSINRWDRPSRLSPEGSPEGDPAPKMPPKRSQKITDFFPASTEENSESPVVSSRIRTTSSRVPTGSSRRDRRTSIEQSDEHSEADNTASKTPTSITSTMPTSFDESSDSLPVTKSGRPSRRAAAVAAKNLKELNAYRAADDDSESESENEETSDLEPSAGSPDYIDDDEGPSYQDDADEEDDEGEDEDEDEDERLETDDDIMELPLAKRRRVTNNTPDIASEVLPPADQQCHPRSKPHGPPQVDLPDPPISLQTSLKNPQSKASKKTKAKKAGPKESKFKFGLDTTLPPLHKLDDIFADMTDNALEEHGFQDALDLLNKREVTLRIATMCSGTESPLLALQMITESLHARKIEFKWKHLFSAEIVPFKQAYIERNFSPEIIFRDIREMLIDGAFEATTAYGGKAEIPGDIDLLIAGFSCVDFSNLNDHKKTLKDKGESGDTFSSVLKYADKFRPKIIILENVAGAPWKDEIIPAMNRIGYAAASERVDTKNYYIPQTRVRGYLVAFDTQVCRQAQQLADEFKPTIRSMKRPTSCSVEAFLLPDDDRRLINLREKGFKHDTNQGANSSEWTRCQARHAFVRNELGLGIRHPLTNWVTGGGCSPVDYMWIVWLSHQVERISDTIDIAWLRDLIKGYDHRYKLRCIDLSQNVDRETDSKPAGVSGCITPTGIPFNTLRGGPVIGLESLSLQGLPIDRLTLTHESQAELQDLAGNAMTSTVVGSVILCALSIGYRHMNLGTLSEYDENIYDVEKRFELTELHGEEDLLPQSLNLEEYQPMSVSQALELGECGIRRCYCEGRTTITRRQLQKCDFCAQTTCVKCGGNPTHQYTAITDQNFLSRRMHPQDVEKTLKQALPMRLKFSSIDAQDFVKARKRKGVQLAKQDEKDWDIVHAYVERAFASELKFHSVIRSETLVACYESDVARLELVIDPAAVEWLLYAKPETANPVDNPVRRLLEKPIARMRPGKDEVDITRGSWALWMYHKQEFKVSIRGGGELIPSFENIQGLKKDTDAFVWDQYILKVSSDNEKKDFGTEVSGTYHSLQKCDMAEGSLYVKKTASSSPRPLYLFLDPDRIRDPKDDFFVISHDKRRLNYGEHRSILAKVNPEWRPPKFELVKSHENAGVKRYREAGSSGILTLSELQNLKSFRLQTAGQWVDLATSFETSAEAVHDEVFEIAPPNLHFNLRGPCKATHVVVSRKARSKVTGATPFPKGHWVQIDQAGQKDFFESNAWLMEKSKTLPGLDMWRNLPLTKVHRCQTCAPTPPSIMWKLNKDSKLEPFEEAREASSYEVALKNRPPPFVIQVLIDNENFIHVKIGLNTRTLVHRAAAVLADVVGRSGIELSSRLVTDSTASESISAFKLKSNNSDAPAATPPGFKIELRPEQARSLSWMLKQESDDIAAFVEEEIEEASILQLGWRAEARARKSVVIRGGLLADEVGYGKTALTLALIDTQRKRDRDRAQENTGQRIGLKATLILVPPHLPEQWEREIRKFIRAAEGYRVIVIKNLADLRKLSISDFQNADIIIASYNICGSDTYLSEMAQFAGAVELPESKSQRVTNSWYENALNRLLENVQILKTDATRLWSKIIADLREDERKASEVETSVPSKRLKGQAYQDAKLKAQNKRKLDDIKSDKKNLKAPQDKFGLDDISKGKRWTFMKCPLFELFNFSRLVIDEYTYTGNAGVCIRNLSAKSKWILSATPPLQDFADIKSIANLLGINLGRTNLTAGVIKKSNIKDISKDWTKSERFHSFNSTYSPAWHLNRHKKAQAFLDQYARRNLAEITAIPESRHLRTVTLPAAERAVYLELQHMLDALDGKNFRRIRANLDNDRERRIKAVLKESKSPEEALMKCATHFDIQTRSSDPGNAFQTCKDITMLRQEQYNGLKTDISKKLKQTEWLFWWCLRSDPAKYYAKYDAAIFDKIEKATEHYITWKEQLENSGCGDAGARNDLIQLIRQAENTKTTSDWAEYYKEVEKKDDKKKEEEGTAEGKEDKKPKKKPKKSKKKKKGDDDDNVDANDDDEDVVTILPAVPMDARIAWEMRDGTNDLRKLVKELVSRQRALRLFENICTLTSLSSNIVSDDNSSNGPPSCDICHKLLSVSTSSILTVCGHIICISHLDRHRSESVECKVEGCDALANQNQIMTAKDLGSGHDQPQMKRHYGRKIRDVVELIRNIPDEEQVLLFTQFPMLSDKMARALEDNSVSFVALAHAKDASKALTEFQTEEKKDVKKKVLLLQIDDASAAGSNLTNANHVIFLSPYLAAHQQTFNATMTQAVGRARRYGQTRPVHVYEFVSLQTVDVDTLEGRRRVVLRAGAPEPPAQLPFAGFVPSPYQFVKNRGLAGSWSEADEDVSE